MLVEARAPRTSNPEVPGITKEIRAQDLLKVSRKTISITNE